MPMVTEEDVANFEREGVVCLRGAIELEWVETLRIGIESDLREPGPHVEVYTKEDEPGRFFNDFDMWRHVSELKSFVLDGPCAGIAGRLMRSQRVNFFFDHLFVKEPGTKTPTHWHQDQPYMAVSGVQFCSSWIPLDPISGTQVLEFVPRSHLWDRWFAPFDSLADGSRHASKVFERLPEIEKNRTDYDIVSWDMEPGDCLFFHGLILHQGGGNMTGDKLRRVISHRWLGDDATYILREPPAEFPKWPTDLRTGDSFDLDPEFPHIWSAEKQRQTTQYG